MMTAGLWRGRKRKVEEVHLWRRRRVRAASWCSGTPPSTTGWKAAAQKLYLIHMIDDATSELTARFVAHDSTEENMRLLWSYLERHGRPVAFYTDKASLFQTAPKIARGSTELPRDERQPAAADADRPGLARVGHRVDCGALTASQRSDRAQFRHRAGPSGERTARGRSAAPWSKPIGIWNRSFCRGGISI